MASKKDKLLESAQRFVLKGQIDKAIKEYQQIVALDPREIRFRQRLAELLVRDNRKDEAVAEYEGIGKHYAENSYFLKAIAVYKQIQRLDSSNPDIAHTLAVLNQKQGLAGNALAEYNNTVRLLEQQGELGKAIAVVREMLDLDGEHIPAHLKLAELLHASGEHAPSYAAFSAVFKRLLHAGDDAAAERVSVRLAELFPGKDEHELELVSLRIQKGDLDGALGALRQAVRQNEKNLRGWQLLCEVLRRKGEKGEVRDALDRMAVLFPEDLGVLRDSIRSSLETGMYEKGAELFNQHADRFIAAGKGKEIEELFLALPAELRSQSQAQEVLRRAYEASGDWEKLNALRAPVLQSTPAAAAAPAPAVAPPVEEHYPAWEEEIDLDFDDHNHAEEAPAAPVAASGSLELEWPDEPAPFLTQGGTHPVSEYVEPEDAPWGELDLDAVHQEPTQEDAAPAGGDEVDFFALHGGAPELELYTDDTAIEPEESLPLELDLRGDDFPSLEVQEEAGDDTVGEETAQGVTWHDIFPEYVQAEGTIDLEDAESHYDLGIAYLEMGRFDAALQEFATAAGNPRRRVDSLILQAMAHRSKNDEESAEELLKKGLLVGELTPQEQLSLRYELASLYERRGTTEQAIPLYREISAIDPSFRDVAQKLALLVGEEPIDIIDLDLEEVF